MNSLFEDLKKHAATLAGRRKWKSQLIDDLENATKSCGVFEFQRYFLDQLVQGIVAEMRINRKKGVTR